MIGYNQIKNYIEDNEFHFDIFLNRIHIVNYTKIISLSDTRIIISSSDKKVTFIGNKLTLVKMFDDELLIKGNLQKVELE